MKLDARIKLLIMVALTTLSILCLDIVYLSMVMVVSIIVDIIFKVKIGNSLKKLKGLLSLVIFITIVQSLTINTGIPLIKFGKYAIVSTDGLILAGEFFIRMCILLSAGLLATTSEPTEFLDGMLKLKIPYRLVFMAHIALRYIPIFRQEFINRLNAIKIRGIDIKQLKLKKKLELYSFLITPTINGSIIRSEQLARSLSARAFTAFPQRTMLNNEKLKVFDYIIMSISLCLVIGFLVFMYIYGGIL